jgi:hypothetical protein
VANLAGHFACILKDERMVMIKAPLLEADFANIKVRAPLTDSVAIWITLFVAIPAEWR